MSAFYGSNRWGDPQQPASPKTKVPIEVNVMRAETGRNGLCPWSVGVMNVTEAEADKIRAFAKAVQMARYSETSMSERAKAAVQATYDAELTLPPDSPKRLLTGRYEPEQKDPEPVAGNRFSGLDIE